jgi:probable F420-dependent oxidoreductase
MRRWGLTVPPAGVRLADLRAHVERAEAAGYTDLWSTETAGADSFTPLSLCAAWSGELRLGTGIAGVFQRGPALLAQEAAALTDASEGRFVLGLGASSDRIVEGWNRIPFERPLGKVRETLDFLDDALAGERTDTGFKLDTAPLHRTPVVLAALRGKMLELAVERADGAFTNYLPLSGLPQVRDALAAAPEGFELLCRFFCFPGTRDEVEPTMRRLFAAYITVPVYREFFRWLGLGEQIAEMVDLWAEGDRKAASAAAPWELIEDTFLFGSPEEIVERVGAFVEGGVTLPILFPIVAPERMAEVIVELAPNPESGG